MAQCLVILLRILEASDPNLVPATNFFVVLFSSSH